MQVPPDYLGLMVDVDLLSTSRLDQDDRQTAQELLKSYYSAEYSLIQYVNALEASLGADDKLRTKYSTIDAIVGAVTGLSSIGVVFATAAIAAPISGVIWIGVSQAIQHYNIDPQIEQSRHQLEEAERLLDLFPDVEKIFDGIVFAETYQESYRRFKKWAAYVKNIQARTSHFFSKASAQQPLSEGASPSQPAISPPPTGPWGKD